LPHQYQRCGFFYLRFAPVSWPQASLYIAALAGYFVAMKNTSINPVELTQELVRINSCNPPESEAPVAEHLGKILEDHGFSTRTSEFKDGRPNLIASYEWSSGPRLCWTGHMDTVPAGQAKWSHDPFGGHIVGNGDKARIVGRGTSDMKAGLAVMTAAACDLAAMKGGKGAIDLVFTAAEETGCEGAASLLNKGILPQAKGILVSEPTGNTPCLGHKGANWLKATVRGKSAHGSMPDAGDNAVYKAARAVSLLADYQLKADGHPILGKPTLSVGTLNGGTKVNMIPDLATFTIDLRTLPGQDHDKVQQELEELMGPEVELTNLHAGAEAIWSEPDDPFVALVMDVLEELSGQTYGPTGLPYFTDGANLAAATGYPPVVIFGPGEAKQAHQTDEFCYVQRIDESNRAYQLIAKRFLGI
jgi:succinyl-diaminopimelate desuccinylase